MKTMSNPASDENAKQEEGRSRSPVVFISYSWTTPAHEEWVLDLATVLRGANGLDVRLDKWGLQTGDDPYLFMERGIVEADKVLIVSDREYARKANAREGGSGTEAQILTPELYAEGGGDGKPKKYAVAVREYDEEGKPCTPTFYGGRIFIEMTDPSRYAEKVEEIARWAYDKPLHVPPPISGAPDFLMSGPSTGTSALRMQAVSALTAGRPNALRAVEDYFDRLVEGLAAFVPEPPAGLGPRFYYGDVTPAVMESVEALDPAYAEAEGVFIELARARLGERASESFRRLFTDLFPYVEGYVSGQHIQDWQKDAFVYLVPDLFRAATAALLRVNDFDGVAELTAVSYTPIDPSSQGQRRYSRGFFRMQRGIENRLLPDAFNKRRRARQSGFTQDEWMQVDLLLFLASMSGRESYYRWWPDYLDVYSSRGDALPIFVKAESKGHLERLARALRIDGDALKSLIIRLADEALGASPLDDLPRLDYRSLTGLDRLGTRP